MVGEIIQMPHKNSIEGEDKDRWKLLNEIKRKIEKGEVKFDFKKLADKIIESGVLND